MENDNAFYIQTIKFSQIFRNFSEMKLGENIKN